MERQCWEQIIFKEFFDKSCTFFSRKIRKNSITVSRSNSQKIESLLSILNKLVDDWEQGIISRKYTKEFAYMIDFSRLNTALLLLHYSGNREEAASYYRQLCVGRLASLPVSSRQAIVLKLPFVLFCVFMRPLYYLYKHLNNKKQIFN